MLAGGAGCRQVRSRAQARRTPPGGRAAIGPPGRDPGVCPGAGLRPRVGGGGAEPASGAGGEGGSGARARVKRGSASSKRLSIMSLRSSFARLLRKQADSALQLQKPAHSVALIGAPFSRGQVSIAGKQAPPEGWDGGGM